MPNRILKESICTSDTIDQLNAEEEVFFYRLLVQCDDYGRADARAAILRAKCYPLRIEAVNESKIIELLASLERAGLVIVYSSNGRQLIQIVKWENHQTIRNKRSKYPAYDSDDMACMQLHANEINCNQLKSIASGIQSESNPYTQSNNGAEAPMDAELESPKKRKPTQWDTTRNNLTEYFCQQTGILQPMQAKDLKRWGIDVGEILRIADREPGCARQLIREALARSKLDGWDVFEPRSLLKTIRKLAGGGMKKGKVTEDGVYHHG